MTVAGAELVPLDEIRAAVPRVAMLARRTPLLDAGLVSGRALHLKCENMQPSGAFKLRGAANLLYQLTCEQRKTGVITYSSGNHGQAVAFAARAVGTPAVVVMPTTAPVLKIDNVRKLGAEVLLDGTSSSERLARAESEAAARHMMIISPWDHPWIIAGQGTVGLEIIEDLPDVAAILVPIGGGGLISGVAAAIKQCRPSVRIVGIEPAGANSMQRSVLAGHPVTAERSVSVADGLLPVRPSDRAFAHVQAFVDAVITVEDSDIIAAMRWLYFDARLVVEPSGAATVAALLSGRVLPHLPEEGAIAAIVSGGNIAPSTLVSLLEVPA
jgi:threonine dehydratase